MLKQHWSPLVWGVKNKLFSELLWPAQAGVNKPLAASPQTPGTAFPWWSSYDIHRANNREKFSLRLTAVFHLGQPTSLAKERIWDIKYERKPQTPKSQSISGLTSLSGPLLRKLCYQGRSKQGISRDFSVWVTFSPCLPPNQSPKKGFFSLSLIF